MKKSYWNKVICGLLAVLMVFCLAACSNNEGTTNNGDTPVDNADLETETMNTVVAVVNGKEITRADIGDALLTSEKEIISEYIYTSLISEFFKDVEVTDTEIDLQMQLIKTQVGEDNWAMYLAYYGGGSEESFKTTLAESLKQEKFIESKAATVEVTDEELAEVYNADPDAYNIVVLDVIFFSDVESLRESQTLYNSGKSLEEIATAMSLTVSSDEHAYFKSDSLTWTKDFNDCSVGDIVFSGEDSGSYVIARVKELNIGIENPTVKNDLKDTLVYDKGYEIANNEYIEFLKTQTASIFGEDYPLYTEESSAE